MDSDLTTINVKDVDGKTWRHFIAQAIIKRIKTGELLSQVLREWLAKETSK